MSHSIAWNSMNAVFLCFQTRLVPWRLGQNCSSHIICFLFLLVRHSASAAEAHGDDRWAVSSWALWLLLPCLSHLNMCRPGMGSAWLLWLSSEPCDLYPTTPSFHNRVVLLFSCGMMRLFSLFLSLKIACFPVSLCSCETVSDVHVCSSSADAGSTERSRHNKEKESPEVRVDTCHGY